MNEEPMHITFFGDAEHLHVRRWVDAMRQRGCKTSFITEQPVTWPGVEIRSPAVDVPIKGLGIGRLMQKRKIAQLLDELKPDIVHGHFIHDTGFTAASTGFHPLVITAWGSDLLVVPERSSEGRRKAEYTLKRADLVTVDSHDLKRAAVELGADPAAVMVVTWGVDTSKYRPAQDTGGLRHSLGLPPTGTLFLSNRRLRPLYRIADIVRAFAASGSATEGAHLIVSSSGPDHEELQELAMESGVGSHVMFTGEVDEMSAIVQAADVFVSVPESDGTAVSLLEAMACGKPAIVSDLPSNREWIEPGVNGWLVDVGDIHQLAQAMKAASSDAERRAAYGHAARARVCAEADADVEMDRVYEAYRGLVAGAPR